MGYKEGRDRENYVKSKLVKGGWLAFRMTGSAGGVASSKVKPIDIIAVRRKDDDNSNSNDGDGSEVMFIQVSKRKRDITEEEIKELKRLADMVGARAVIAYTRKDKNNRKIIRYVFEGV
jgi:Holliday junction resolvase